ncbi:uncharacterized protein LOC129939137 [Eupeodes corollae]|uniref:uncharacterized protein LOC129939137 n=1 Tax=Eupeodes corollae TaxID=290404 RepID=UPI00249116BE|nr:uncharacterized protein LOC129939137 [Eupeodes corollae]
MHVLPVISIIVAGEILFTTTSATAAAVSSDLTSGSQPTDKDAIYGSNSKVKEQQLSSWWNIANLPLYVDYFRFHGVGSVGLVLCPEDVSGRDEIVRPIGRLVRGFLASQMYVNVFRDNMNLDHDVDDDDDDDDVHQFTLNPLSYKTGIIVNLDGSCAWQTLRAAEQRNLFTTNRFWLLLSAGGSGKDGTISDVFIPPDGEVRLLMLSEGSLLDVYKVDAGKPMRVRQVGRNITSSRDLVTSLQQFGSAISYRENLEGLEFRTGLVIAFPDMYTDIEDLTMRHIDTITKVNYPLTRALSGRFNISFNTHQTDNWGWKKPNGSFDGLMGRFQRYELDFSQNAIFMRLDRVAVVHFVVETFRIRAGIMFRQPPLSAVANIFALPFNYDVWIAVAVFIIFTAIIMSVELAFSPLLGGMDFGDCIVFVWGAICQQGFYVNIPNRSARILVFTTFVTTLFLFTSFSANIVALLQSPSEAIGTLGDLGQSPLEIGVQDTVYNKIFFNESTDPVTRTLFQKKIQPKGENVYMRPNMGMERVRTGLFAYQVELQAGYQVISDTYAETEKCGLKELEPFKLPILAIPVRKNFPYKELFRRQIRWQREVGLMNREELKWFPQKPKCEGSVGGFVSIGLTECRYAFALFGYGFGLAVSMLFVEILMKKLVGLVGNEGEIFVKN